MHTHTETHISFRSLPCVLLGSHFYILFLMLAFQGRNRASEEVLNLGLLPSMMFSHLSSHRRSHHQCSSLLQLSAVEFIKCMRKSMECQGCQSFLKASWRDAGGQLHGEEHWVQVPAPTWRCTIVCNFRSRGPTPSSGHLHKPGTQTYIQANAHIKLKLKTSKK